MSINFIRIDDRVIHGQLVTRWSKERNCDGIIAVDDNIVKDEVLCQVLKSAVPNTIKTFIFDVDTFISKFPKIQESNKHYFLIVKSPITLQRISEKINLLDLSSEINVGPMSTRDDSITIGANASILPQEAIAFNHLESLGLKVEFRLVPDSNQQFWNNIKDKFDFKI